MNESELIETLVDEGGELLIKYGSAVRDGAQPEDIDLFVVGTDTRDRGNFQLGDFDVIRQSWNEFNHLKQRLDPVYVTEPVLAGQILRDERDVGTDIRTSLRNHTPDRFVINYLVSQAISEYQRAQRDGGDPRSEALGFAASYWAFACWYHNGGTPVQLRELIENCANSELLSRLVQGKGSPDSLDSGEAQSLVLDLFLGSTTGC